MGAAVLCIVKNRFATDHYGTIVFFLNRQTLLFFSADLIGISPRIQCLKTLRRLTTSWRRHRGLTSPVFASTACSLLRPNPPTLPLLPSVPAFHLSPRFPIPPRLISLSSSVIFDSP